MSDELLTILFTDVEGSTALHTARGDAEARRILGACDEVVREQVRKHGGREIKSTGDGFMIAFGSPRKAVACALAIQEAVTRRGDAVRVRAGLHIGEVSEEGGDLFGGAVNAAARICAKAAGGEVLVSDVVRQLYGTASDVSFTERGLLKLKGFPERWRLSEATPHVRGIPVSERTPFVGREAERAELRTLMQRALAGEGGLILIGGEPGVGKSRLCQEIAAEARPRFRVFVGHCYEGGRDLPYMPWVELVETAMRETAPETLRDAFGDDAPELARLVPQLRRLFPDLPPPVEVPPEQQRRYAFNSFREWVTRFSRVQPRFYVLEDLHWADESTLLLLEHLAERLTSIPCLIVGTYRDPPIDVSPQLGDTLSGLVSRRHARLLSLQRHSEQEVAALLRALSGQAPPTAVGAAIYGETEGNAFFVEEVFRHLAESGRLLDEGGRFRDEVALGVPDVPANVRLVTGQRLQRLSETTQRVLGVAAVAGRRMDFELLEAITEVQGDQLIDALDEAERARLIITETEGASEEHWFAHELIRQTLLAGLPAARRRRHHLRVADALERLHGDDLSAHAATIAQHLAEAGSAADRSRLFRYLVVAGRRALESAAFEEALRHFERAGTLTDAALPQNRAELLFDLGMAQRSTGSWEAAIDAWRQSVDACEQAGDREAVGRVCVYACVALMFAIRFPEAGEMCERGLASLGNTVSADRARLLGTAGALAGFNGSYETAAELIDQEIGLAAELGDGAVLGDALRNKCFHHFGWHEHADAAEAGLRSAALLREAGDLFNVAAVLAWVALDLIQLGRIKEAQEICEELEPLAERVGNYVALLQARRAVATAQFFTSGDCGRLERYAQAELADLQRQGVPWLMQAWGTLGVTAFLRGDWETARTRFVEGERLKLPSIINWATGPLFECLGYLGERSQALALLNDGVAELPQPGRPNGWGAWTTLFSVVEGLTVLGERERAAELYPLVVEGLQRTKSVCGSYYDGRLLERVAGIAATAGRRFEEAEAHFETALAQARDIPHRPEEAHTRRWYGGMLIDRDAHGDHERARTVLEKGVAGYRGMRMPRHEAMVRELLVGVDAGRVHG